MAEKKNKKTTTAEKQLAMAMVNTMPKNIDEMGSLIKTGSTDKNIVSKVTGPRKQQTLTAVRTDDGDVKIDASQKDINEVIRNSRNWDGYKKHIMQEIENEIKNNLVREKYGEKNNTTQDKDEKSPYANMSYGELSEKIKEVDSDLSRGIITADEAHSRQYEIDLWRIKKASTDELKKLREYWNEASEDMTAEARAVSFNSGLSMIPSDEEVTKTDHADKYKDLVAAADAMLSTHKMMKEYDNELVEWGKKAIASGASDKYVPTEYAEKNSDVLVDIHDIINEHHSGKRLDDVAHKTLTDNYYDMLTEGELRLYNTLHNDNPSEAEAFLKGIRPMLEKRSSDEYIKEWSEFADKNALTGAVASVASIGQNLTSAIPAVVEMGLESIDGDIGGNGQATRQIRASQAIRQSVSENLGDVGGFFYNAGMSIADNLSNLFVFGGAGKAAGSLVSLNLAGSSAASGMISAADRGGSDKQIILSGLANGVAEYVFEKVSVERLLKPTNAKGIGNWIKNTLIQSGVEGSEEVFTEISNIMTDALIMQGNSENAIRRRGYVMQGMSAEEAVKKVLHENITQIVLAGAAGALSGGVMSGTKGAISNVSYRSSMGAIGASVINSPDALRRVVQIGLENGNGEAKYVSQLMAEGIKIDAAQASKLVDSVITDSLGKKGDITNVIRSIAAIEGRDADYYTSREAIDTARAVMDFVRGEGNARTNAIIENSRGARGVVLALSENKTAWDSVKREADKRMQNAKGKMQNAGSADVQEKNFDGVKYSYAGRTKNGIKKYVTDFPNDMSAEERAKIFKDRIATIFNLGAVKLKTDTKKIEILGDKFTVQKNLHGDDIASENEMQAKVNSLYDMAEILSDAEYVKKRIEPSYVDPAVEPKNKAHKDVKYWYKFKNTISMDGVVYDVVFNIRDKGKEQYQYLIEFHETNGGNSNQPYSQKNLRRTLDELPPDDSITNPDGTVNSNNMQNGEKDAQNEVVKNNVVVNEYSERLRKENPKAYNNIVRMAKRLGLEVRFVKNLTNAAGKRTDGKITKEGIFIDADAKNPSRFVATHEVSHYLKQKSSEMWEQYQRYAIERLHETGKYDDAASAKANDYEKSEIDEEIACDYIGDMFDSEAELEAFIRWDRPFAVKIRDMWYSFLDKLGMLDEKAKAKQLWLKAYTAAMKDGGKEFGGEKLKIVTMSDGSGRKYVHATQKVIKSKDPNMWESEIMDYVNKMVRKNKDVVIPLDNEENIVITGRTAWKLSGQGKMQDNYYLIKGNAAGVINEIIGVSKSVDAAPPYKEHSDGFAKYGFDYRTAYFMDIDGKYYRLKLSVGINAEGKEAYDIENIRRMTFPSQGSKAQATKATGKSSSTPMVSQDNSGVNNYSMPKPKKNSSNEKSSVAGTRLSDVEERRMAENLEEENKRLREQMENVFLQLNQAEGKGLDTKAIKQAAQNIKRAYGSKISVLTLHQELTKLYTYMSGSAVSGDEVAERIKGIAEKVIENATETIDTGEYAELLDTIKNTRIAVPEDDKASFADGYEHFRKRSMGKLLLAKNGYPLDALWDDLCEQYPHLFDENTRGSEERLNRILEVREEFRPFEESIYKTDASMKEAKTALENDIMESFYNIPEGSGHYVFYDKRAGIAEKALAEREAELERQKEKYTDRFSKDKLKKRIDSDFKYLHRMVENPTDQRHIPEEMRADVAALMRCINFETKQLDRIKAEGKAEESVTAIRLDKIRGLYESIIRKAWGIDKNADTKLIDEYLSEDLRELMESIPVDESGEAKRLQDMSIEEMRAVSNVLRGIHHAVTESNKAFSKDIKETISAMSDNVCVEMADKRASRRGSGEKADDSEGLRKALAAIDKLFNVDMMQPWDMFHRIGGTLEKLYGEERKAFNRHIQNIQTAAREIKKACGDIKIKRLTGKNAEKITFALSNGNSIELSRGQILSLYSLYMRPQGKEHLLEGGIVTGRRAKDQNGSRLSTNRIHKVNETDLGKMFEKLSDKEKQMAKDIVLFMSKECARWGNEASMKLYGYEKYGEGWYFPIKVADSTLQTYSGEKGEGNLRTQSFTKKLVKNARNAVEVGDFFDIVISHINGMSLYNTIALPMLDMERVLNRTTEGETVRQEINVTYGKEVNAYLGKFHEDLNGSRKQRDSDGFVSAMFRNAKKASIGLNTRVLIQQPTSIVRAMLFISPIDFAAARYSKVLKAEMQERVPIAYWKSLGFRDVGIGSSMKDAILGLEGAYDKVAMGGYGAADDFAWTLLYSAIKNEVKRKNPDIAPDSDDFIEKVIERFDYIVDRSQVVDSVFHRTQNMRSNSEFTKNATMFMSEPLKTLNMFRTEIEDSLREGNAGEKLSRATAVYLFSNFILALAQAIPDTWREDDEDELYDENGAPLSLLKRYADNLAEDFADNLNPFNMVPYVKDIVSIIKGYDMKRVEYSNLANAIGAVSRLKKDNLSIPERIMGFVKPTAAVFGISIGNLMRDVEGITKTIVREVGDEYADYTIMKFKYNVKNPQNKERFLKYYKRALSNGRAGEAEMILKDYMSQTFKGKDFENGNAEAVLGEMAKVYKKTKSENVIYKMPDRKFSFDGEDIELNDEDYGKLVEGAYSILWDMAYEFTNSKEYSGLSAEEKAEGFKDLKTYAQNVQKQEFVDGYELDAWQKDVHDGEKDYSEYFSERKAEREYMDSRDQYKKSFEVDEEKYTSDELGVIEKVESDAASYYASVEKGRGYNEKTLRHIKVYDEKLSDVMPIEEYAGVRAYAKKTAAMSDGKESMKKDELTAYLRSTDYPQSVKRALFEAIGSSNWKNPF